MLGCLSGRLPFESLSLVHAVNTRDKHRRSSTHKLRDTLDHKNAVTIATSLAHYRLDYCNSLYFSLSAAQLHRLQLIQNALGLCLALLFIPVSLPFFVLSIVLKSSNEFNIK